MRRPLSTWLLTACALGAICAACPARADEPPKETPKPFIQRVGYSADRVAAEHAIAFRPFVPSSSIIAAALLPPFHEDHVTSKLDGIGYTYDNSGHKFTFREWPRADGTLAAFPSVTLDKKCNDVHALGGTQHPNGYAWASKTKVYSLTLEGEPNDARSARALRTEWRRIVRRGACR